jgi:preprotein translocase subunit SecG
MSFIFGSLLTGLAIFLILLVLVQRGRGGGLTGALGGMGGSSAFGAKAGDIFTRITIVVAGIWIVACALAGYWANNQSDRLGSGAATTSAATTDLEPSVPPLESPGTGAPANSGTGTSGAAPATPATPAPATPQ